MIADASLAFDSQLLKDGLEVWRTQAGAGGIPRRSSFTPRTVQSFMGSLMIFQREKRHRYRARLMGTKVSAVIGEMQGKLLDEALPREAALRWMISLDRVLSALKPVRIVNTAAFINLDFLEAELLLAPLLDDEGQPSMVYTVTAFRCGVATAPARAPVAAKGV